MTDKQFDRLMKALTAILLILALAVSCVAEPCDNGCTIEEELQRGL
jgi:hypothetical protein